MAVATTPAAARRGAARFEANAATRDPLWVKAVILASALGFFALFHGFAHGSELGNASATPFLVGFALATALLHAAGVLLGPGIARLAGDKAGRLVTRFAGGLTALAGLALIVGG